MTKTQKELAFLRELEVDAEWTEKFTNFVDKSLELSGEDNILYLNAGTGNHAIALREKLHEDIKISATVENEDLLSIARDKAAAVRAGISILTAPPAENSFDAVLADASFVRPENLPQLFKEAVRVAEPQGKVIVFAPTAGSFGEVFSYLWEIFFNDDLGECGAEAERLINEIPTVSRFEEIAADAGLKKIETQTHSEIFEYENGVEFVNSPLVADFLLPVWLKCLDEKQKEQVLAELTQLINAEEENLSFRFSVKISLLTGEK
jgi:ubiquinone/menaquinone biosynthesis C-methylase UbiE